MLAFYLLASGLTDKPAANCTLTVTFQGLEIPDGGFVRATSVVGIDRKYRTEIAYESREGSMRDYVQAKNSKFIQEDMAIYELQVIDSNRKQVHEDMATFVARQIQEDMASHEVRVIHSNTKQIQDDMAIYELRVFDSIR
ncbi:hypothetical protein DPMN_124189 [Dreissena polymorpha]|uniref:Uncharacterized protein n=1 Tax=Dreissena polymorpha TaxID=45954 RepID=A0A9D4JSA0_DREPO|nr:hypothetical protein DPMN_124189 [Dreissena polymorpha]